MAYFPNQNSAALQTAFNTDEDEQGNPYVPPNFTPASTDPVNLQVRQLNTQNLANGEPLTDDMVNARNNLAGVAPAPPSVAPPAPQAPAPAARAPRGGSGPIPSAIQNLAMGAATSPQAAQPSPLPVPAVPNGSRNQGPPMDPELAAAQAKANDQAGLMSAMGLIADASANFAGNKSPMDWYKERAAAAQVPVQQLIQRREEAAKLQAQQRTSAAMDPSSDVSKRAQAVVEATLPGLFSKEQLATLSAADVKDAKDPMDLWSKSREAAAKTTSEEKIAGERNKTTLQEARIRSAGEIEAAKQRIQSEQGVKMNERNIPGYHFAAGGVPSEKSANEWRSQSAALDTATQALEDYRKDVEANGTEMMGASGATQDAKYVRALSALDALEKTGYRGPALQLMREQLPKSSGIGGKFSRSSTITAGISEAEKQLQNEKATTARAMGYEPDAPADGATGPHGATVKQGNYTYTWNPSTKQYE